VSAKVLVGDIVDAVEDAFPASWAEPWDAVGLRVGDRKAVVTGVLVTLDPTREALDTALACGANVLVTHHPPSLDAHATFTAGGPASVLFAAAHEGIAIVSAHTNLDRSPRGGGVLLEALSLGPGAPLESAEAPMSLVTVYVPPEYAEELRAAMAAAGGGRIGEYEACSFTASGVGRFAPRAGAQPTAGEPEGPSAVEEERVEMVCEPSRCAAVIAAARHAHPYEEPLIVRAEIAMSRGAARLGRLAKLEEPTTVEALARRVADTFGCTPRVWGDCTQEVFKLATATGSGGSLLGSAIAGGADAILLGEVRYHDALDAAASGLAVIEAGHDVTEWPLVPVLAEAVAATPGIDAKFINVDEPRRGWWTP